MNEVELEKDYLLRFKRGDAKAFTFLFDRYWKELYLAAYRHVRDEDLSKDIIQEVFIHLWERRELIGEDYHSLKPYLLTSVKNRVLNHYASEKVKKQVLDRVLLRLELMDVNSNISSLDYRRLETLIHDAVAVLPDKLRTVYLMRNNDQSIKYIANSLNMAEQTVKNYLSEANSKLRSYIEKQIKNQDLIYLFIGASVTLCTL